MKKGKSGNRYKKMIAMLCAMLFSVALMPGCAAYDPEAPARNLPVMASVTSDSALQGLTDPASEVRGVYIAAVYNIDFPSAPDLSASALKKELDAILDSAQAAGLNTVYFQVRPTCDALYKSELFPVSKNLSTKGKLTMDPLGYIVKEAHKRGMFLHAWVNPLRASVGSATQVAKIEDLPDGSPAKENPSWTKLYADGRLYMDPGYPQVRQLVADGVREIVENYDVDGVIFDDYFYPYPQTDASGVTVAFDDAESYKLYGNGMNRGDWRRDNANRMIKLVYDTVKSVSEDVQFGVAPFGIWKNDDGKNGGSATKGLQSYSAIYCDPIAWAQGGYVDYLAPQIYWRFSTAVAPYDELVRWWNRALDGTGVELLISHAAYQYDGWEAPQGEIAKQVQYARSELTYRGSIFYGYEEIRENTASLRDELKEIYTERIVYTEPSPTGLAPSVSSPAAGMYLSTKNTYLIGSSSPDKPLYINGEKVGRSRGGYFSYYAPLAKGENVFTLEQDGVKTTHVIYRGTPETEEKKAEVPSAADFSVIGVSPAQNVLAESGGSVTVSCKAPAGSTVYAHLGDTSVRLKQSGTVGKADSGWALATYSAKIALPRTGNDEIADLGEILVTAEQGKHEASAGGASVRVRGKNAYVPVEVKGNHTELKLGFDTLYYNDFSVQSAGMRDYALWQGNGFYLLRVGGYVYEDSVTELAADEKISVASIASARVYAEGEHTYLDFALSQNVPHNGTVRDGNFELTLYNVDTSSVPKNIPVQDNPLIKSIRVIYPNKANCVRFLCELYDSENFYGFDFAYTEGGARAILKNPRRLDLSADMPLSGVRIVLDAGHGGNDSGARGPLMNASGSVTEKDLNLAVTLAARDRLAALGATVILTREDDTAVSLTQRMNFLIETAPDLSVSVHHNSVDYSVDVRGIYGTLGLWWADSGVLLTRCVSRGVADALWREELTPKQQMLALCRNPKFPSTLVEVGFMTSVEEYEFMLSGGVERAAEGIARGVLDYFAEQAKWVK